MLKIKICCNKIIEFEQRRHVTHITHAGWHLEKASASVGYDIATKSEIQTELSQSQCGWTINPKKKIEENRKYFKRNGTNGIECNRFLCQVFRFYFNLQLFVCVFFFLCSRLRFSSNASVHTFRLSSMHYPLEARNCVISIIHFVVILFHFGIHVMCVLPFRWSEILGFIFQFQIFSLDKILHLTLESCANVILRSQITMGKMKVIPWAICGANQIQSMDEAQIPLRFSRVFAL